MTLPTSIAARAILATDRASWLGARGIGGSDVAAIRGTPGAFLTAWDVWVDHQPGVQRVDREDPILAEGHDAELYAAARLRRATGLVVEHTPHLVVRHPEFPWATVSPDGLCTDAGGETGGHEGKTDREGDGWGPSGEVLGAPDATLIPARYLDQVYWGLEVTGLPWWIVTVLLPRSWGMPELRWYRVLRNVEHQRRILLEVARWRQRHLVGGVEPAIDDSAAARAWLDRRGATKRPVRDATPEETELVARLAWAREQRDRFTAEVKATEAQLAELFGDETYGVRIPGMKCLRIASRSAPVVDLDTVRARCPEAITREGTTYRKFNLYPTKER